MTDLRTEPLTERFGVILKDFDLNDVTQPGVFPLIRALFEEHSALLFPAQDISDEAHLTLAGLFGPIEDRLADERKAGEAYKIPQVSNVTEAGLTGEMDLHTLNLQANFLWHADSTFMPTPALANILIARVVPESGGATELASTRAAWAEMPEELKARLRGKRLRHRYAHSRARISPELAALPMFHKWPDQLWPAIWTNPVNGQEAVYIASHACAVEGMEAEEGAALIDEVIAFCTQPRFTYSHDWQVGDVLIWDQRAVLHRGTPWPYQEPRTLSSLCVSVTEADGLEAMRSGAGSSEIGALLKTIQRKGRLRAVSPDSGLVNSAEQGKWSDRIRNFEEVDLVVTQEQMQIEAARCMRCGTLCYFDDQARDTHVHGKGLRDQVEQLIQISPRR